MFRPWEWKKKIYAAMLIFFIIGIIFIWIGWGMRSVDVHGSVKDNWIAGVFTGLGVAILVGGVLGCIHECRNDFDEDIILGMYWGAGWGAWFGIVSGIVLCVINAILGLINVPLLWFFVYPTIWGSICGGVIGWFIVALDYCEFCIVGIFLDVIPGAIIGWFVGGFPGATTGAFISMVASAVDILSVEWAYRIEPKGIKAVIEKELESMKSLQRWAESVGIETDFYEIMEVVVSDSEKGIELASKFIDELRAKKKEYEEMMKRWKYIERKYKRAGLSTPKMPKEYEKLKKELRMLERGEKKVSISVNFQGDIIANIWSKGEIIVKNEGEINLEDVRIEVNSRVVEVEGIREIGDLKRGEEKRIAVRIKSRDAGYVPVEMKIRYRNPLTDAEGERTIYPEMYVKKGEDVRSEIPKGSEIRINIDYLEKALGDKYEIISFEGSGRYYNVYKAKRKSDGETVALKVPKVWNEGLSRMFIEEVRKWKDILDENAEDTIKIYYYSAYPFGYIEMEYLRRIDKVPMDWESAARIMRRVARALWTAHRLREPIYHMDVKPSNILLDSDGRAKLGDWGLAQRKIEMRVEDLGGTVAFASPEVLMGDIAEVDARSDIFSWGATFYYLVTGKYPFPGKDEEEIMEKILGEFEPEPVRKYAPDVPEDVEKIIMKCLKKRKSERYQNIWEVFHELSVILNEPPTVPLTLSKYMYIKLLADSLEFYAEKADLTNVRATIKKILEQRRVPIPKDIREELRKRLHELSIISDEISFRENSELRKKLKDIANGLRDIIDRM